MSRNASPRSSTGPAGAPELAAVCWTLATLCLIVWAIGADRFLIVAVASGLVATGASVASIVNRRRSAAQS